ncbi:maleylpyruvate isomerase family mycothiol-dependent enzyme [Nocardioides daejeonensis]|uniref:maleylpyruvate isomerase family mycothiol-dependent enzyme n=1 Tax=Nocardioides daejeonensis TaxID=1046556 RepID=UPI000D74257D|nr:maleylpyruvate isomerase family mycothiol-dependent enzyme [Nocardioides daejeonensis]
MSDAEELAGFISVWQRAVDDFSLLLEEVPADAWATETDLPGWDVHAIAAHVAHLEALLAGAAHEEVEIGSPAHVKGMLGTFTEQGVVARRDRSPAELIDEIRRSVAVRADELAAAPPTDGDAPAPGLFGAIGWSQRTLLRNRPLDIWMHEQDIRRAIGSPGNLDSPAGAHVVAYLLEALGVVVAKRAGCPAGTSVVVEVDGVATTACLVGDDGRAAFVEPPASPTARLSMSVEAYAVLAGGRGAADDVDVRIEGDTEVAERVLAAMAVTP